MELQTSELRDKFVGESCFFDIDESKQGFDKYVRVSNEEFDKRLDSLCARIAELPKKELINILRSIHRAVER